MKESQLKSVQSLEGAHNILQIRTSRFSKTWEQDWKMAQAEIYKKVA